MSVDYDTPSLLIGNATHPLLHGMVVNVNIDDEGAVQLEDTTSIKVLLLIPTVKLSSRK
jgi:hypothetical protein